MDQQKNHINKLNLLIQLITFTYCLYTEHHWEWFNYFKLSLKRSVLHLHIICAKKINTITSHSGNGTGNWPRFFYLFSLATGMTWGSAEHQAESLFNTTAKSLIALDWFRVCGCAVLLSETGSKWYFSLDQVI